MGGIGDRSLDLTDSRATKRKGGGTGEGKEIAKREGGRAKVIFGGLGIEGLCHSHMSGNPRSPDKSREPWRGGPTPDAAGKMTLLSDPPVVAYVSYQRLNISRFHALTHLLLCPCLAPFYNPPKGSLAIEFCGNPPQALPL